MDKTPGGPLRQALAAALVVAGILAMSSAALGSGPASAAAGSLSVAPTSQQVDAGEPFTIEIRHSADVEISGLQFSMQFDPSLVQVVSITRGAEWQNLGASFLLGVAPQTQAQAIAESNSTGLLKGAGLFISPGSSIPAGTGTAFTIGMQARSPASGLSTLALSNVGMLDLLGESVPTGAGSGSVTVGDGSTATPTTSPTTTNTPDPSQSATPTFTASNTPTVTATRTPTNTATVTGTSTPTGSVTATLTATPTLTVTTPTVTAAAGSASMKLVPSEQTVPPGSDVTIHVSHTAAFDVSGAETDVVFNQSILQIISVTKSPAYEGAGMLAGVQQTLAEAIAEANSTGRLKNVAVYYTPGQGKAAAGENAFITLALKANSIDGSSDVKLENVEMIDLNGDTLAVSSVSGKVVVQTGAVAPTPVPPPVAAGSGSTSGTGGSSSGSTSASERFSSAAGATRLPNAGEQRITRQLILFVAGLAMFVVGTGVAADGWRRRAARK